MTYGYGFWGFSPLRLIQGYWIIWLVFSFVVSFVLGGVILRNWETVK